MEGKASARLSCSGHQGFKKKKTENTPCSSTEVRDLKVKYFQFQIYSGQILKPQQSVRQDRQDLMTKYECNWKTFKKKFSVAPHTQRKLNTSTSESVGKYSSVFQCVQSVKLTVFIHHLFHVAVRVRCCCCKLNRWQQKCNNLDRMLPGYRECCIQGLWTFLIVLANSGLLSGLLYNFLKWLQIGPLWRWCLGSMWAADSYLSRVDSVDTVWCSMFVDWTLEPE